MVERLLGHGGRVSSGKGIFLGTVTIGMAGLSDYLTGPYMWWDFVYVLPVALFAWLSPWRAAMWLSSVAGATTFVVNEVWSVPERHALVPLWNGCVTGATCFALAFAITKLRSVLQKYELVSNVVSHDLMNILTAMRMNTDVLMSQTEPGDTRSRFIQSIDAANLRMRRIVNDLAIVSQLDGHALEIHAAPLDVARLVGESVRFRHPAATRKNVQLHLGEPVEPVQVFADHERIAEVLDNLLGNAIKFTPPGGSIEIWLKAGPSDVEVHVRDSGPGVAPADRASVFKPYWQGRLGREGAGLGLYIAKVIVEKHGGQIWIEQAEQGAHFAFRLPREGKALPSKG